MSINGLSLLSGLSSDICRTLTFKISYSAFGDLSRKASDLSNDMTEDLQYFEQNHKLPKGRLDHEEQDNDLLEQFQAMERAMNNYCFFATGLLTTEAGKPTALPDTKNLYQSSTT
ncbi:MAG: hypothetical protein M1830_001008 [Pleopsidium flavum]|nr:MAG: hypothetical protein M1830_001008 [Pleopsidium flavum]